MKPFNLEAALRGEPVITRDGRKVHEVIAFSKQECNKYPYVVFALYKGAISYSSFTKDGFVNDKNTPSPRDLFMAPRTREGWVPLFRNASGKTYIIDLYNTKEEAENAWKHSPLYITSTKITWEE